MGVLYARETPNDNFEPVSTMGVGNASQSQRGLMTVPDKVKLDGIADYIVEQGTSGIWTYRKWNSGIAECWGNTGFTSTALTQWGAVYDVLVPSVNFPSGLFNATPELVATAKEGYAGVVGYGGNTQLTKDHTQDFMWLRGGSAGNVSGKLSMHAIGNWK